MKCDIRDYFDKHKVQPAIGLISMCRYNNINNNSRQVIYDIYDIYDGQHRIEVIKQLFNEEGLIIAFNVGIVNVRSRAEAEMQYLMFNKSLNHSDTLHIVHDDNKDQLIKQCQQWLLNTYGHVFVSRVTKRPYINIKCFMDAFVKSDYYKPTYTLEQFQENFFNYNSFLIDQGDNILTLGKNKISQITVQKIVDHGIYFAFLSGDDYFCLI